MKRGERLMWRKLADAIDELIKSDDYAKEYMARRDIEFIVDTLKNRNYGNVVIFESLNLARKLSLTSKGGE